MASERPRWQAVAGIGALGILALTVIAGGVAAVENQNVRLAVGPAIVHIQPPPPAPVGVRTKRHASNFVVITTSTVSTANARQQHTRSRTRADMTLVVHVSANRNWAEAVSIPADATYRLPVCAKAHPVVNRLSVAFAHGGPACTIQLIEAITHLRIEHYLVLNDTALKYLVSDVGGLPMCVRTTTPSPVTRLGLRPGTQILSGAQTVALLQASAAQSHTSDATRSVREGIVLTTLIREAYQHATLANANRAEHVLRSISRWLTVDPGLVPSQRAVNFVVALHSIAPRGVLFVPLPTRYNYADHTVRMAATAKTMWRALDHDKPWPLSSASAARRRVLKGPPLTVPPTAIQVQVRNGTTSRGAAVRLGNQLSADSFTFLGGSTFTSTKVKATFIQYDPTNAAAARTLDAALGGVRMVAVPGLGQSLAVVLGAQRPQVLPVYTARRLHRPVLPIFEGPHVVGVMRASHVQCLTG